MGAGAGCGGGGGGGGGGVRASGGADESVVPKLRKVRHSSLHACMHYTYSKSRCPM